ncbi:MAG: hypothetical protein WB729_06890 [Candidatus Sulfotelmatobacter sp.]
MSAIELQISPAVIESAVSETVKRMNASAHDLMLRRAEINRRIHRIQRVMEGLRALAVSQTWIGSDARPAEPKHEVNGFGPHDSIRARANEAALDLTLLDGAKHREPGLSRACRIALLESSTATLEEIRERIVRRGSFSFADSASADAGLIRTLNFMVEIGEVRCVAIANQKRWQRIATAETIDGSSPPGVSR